MPPLGMVRLLFNAAALLGQLIDPSTLCRAMPEEDTKSNSHLTSSQQAMSEDDAADENVGNSNGATHPRPSLEEGIADAAPAATPAAAPSTTPAAGRISTENRIPAPRSEEHTSELQSHYSISYAVFCLKKKKKFF